MSARKCRECAAPLEIEDGRWVDARSGDVGGTYDYCPASYDAAHRAART